MTRALCVGIAVLWAGLGGGPAALAAVTNAVPWWDAFESYPDGMAISGTNGWITVGISSATVTSAAGVTGLLTNYPTGGKSYPLPAAAHSNVLQIATPVRSDIGGRTGGVVKVDFMVLPLWMEVPPTGDTSMQCSFCISTNGLLTIWHHNTAVSSNEWRELTNSPVIGTNEWSRFTIVSDYSNGLFRVSVNEGDAISDAAGWVSATGGPGGAWYHMVQTNRVLSGFKADGDPAYLEDIVLTNRTLAWSGSGFYESTPNDGTVATNPAFTVTLAADTFNGTPGGDLVAAGLVVATHVPAGLTAVVTRVSATQVGVTLAGVAALHESANSIADLGLEFTDAAFGYGSAWDVAGYRRTALTVTFSNTPSLTWSTNAFGEAAANDGTIESGSPLLIDLAYGTFNGNIGEDLATNGAKLVVSGVPAGLTAEATLQSVTRVRVRLLGTATSHAAADSVSGAGLAFQDGAFNGVPASSVFHASTNVSITFADPGGLIYAATTFAEVAANNGAVSSTSVSLSNKTFNATNGENLVVSGKVTGANVPPGLTLAVVVSDNQHAAVSLNGNATSHAAANSIANLGIAFLDGAFNGGNAAAVSNRARSDLAVVFLDPPAIAAAGGTAFSEAPVNNGSIGNTLTLTLTGDTFVNAAYVANTHYTVTNVPGGLSFGLAYSDATHMVASLTGSASAHAASNTISNLRLTFLTPAFMTVAASNVTGHPVDFAVTFSNPPVLTYSGSTFREVSGGVIDNRAPVAIALAGETFAGTDGDDFVSAGRVVAANVPPGLTASLVRSSATQLSVTLTGRATAHSGTDSVHNMTFTFQSSAFAAVPANQVAGYQKSDLAVVFTNESAFFNVIPYEEPFESYANGTPIDGTNGWVALYDPYAAWVTNDAVAASNLSLYTRSHTAFPVDGAHTKVLRVKDYIQNAIHSETEPRVYVDFMAWPVPLQAPPESDTNVQCAFYVSTNSQLVIWHRNTSGGSPVNEWRALTNAGTLDTSRWFRLTILQDYSNRMFQVQLNEGLPIVDDTGWTEGGTSRTGSWFRMVQTNATLSGFRVSGVGDGFLDDLTVKTRLSDFFGVRSGSVFKLR